METPTSTTTNDRLISLKQAASQLGISLRGLYRLMASGALPRPVKVGGASKLFESDLNTYLQALRNGRAA